MRKIAIAIFGLVVVVAAWTGMWVFGASQLGHQVDLWLAAEDAQGRLWRCPQRAIGGYPFALTVSCTGASFLGHALGQSVEGRVALANAEASLAHPRRIVVTLSPPFTYRSSDGATDLRGRWTSLRIDLDGLPDLASVALAGSDIALDGLFGPAGAQHLGSARLKAQIGLPAAEPDPTLVFDIAVAGTEVPQIDALVGDTQAADLHLEGQLDRTDIGDVRTPEEAMDRWRRAGGHIDLAASTIDRGTSHVGATGTLRLDDDHRPQGRLDTQVSGLEPILKRYGINANLAAAGALLGTLFGGAPKQAVVAAGAIAVPIVLQDGRIGIGPIRTAITLQPLY